MEQLAKDLLKLLQDEGALDSLLFDGESVIDWTDYLIIATFTSERQGLSLLEKCQLFLKEQGIDSKISGATRQSDNGWLLLDAGTMVVNLLSPDRREFYNLEELWAKAKQLVVG